MGYVNEFDVVLIRYLPHDFFLYFLIRKINKPVYTVHHTIENYELAHSGKLGIIKVWLDNLIFKSLSKHLSGILAVTEEIAKYEINRSTGALTEEDYVCFPNGILLNEEGTPNFALEEESIPNILFIASHFSPWQGLDKLLLSASRSNKSFLIHLVGSVPIEYQSALAKDSRFKIHGTLSKQEIKGVASSCTIGLGPLASERLGMRESCALKVREYLSLGLPVYSQDLDVFPSNFLFYRVGGPDILEILNYSKHISSFPRKEIVTCAKKYISKPEILADTYNWLLKRTSGSKS